MVNTYLFIYQCTIPLSSSTQISELDLLAMIISTFRVKSLLIVFKNVSCIYSRNTYYLLKKFEGNTPSGYKVTDNLSFEIKWGHTFPIHYNQKNNTFPATSSSIFRVETSGLHQIVIFGKLFLMIPSFSTFAEFIFPSPVIFPIHTGAEKLRSRRFFPPRTLTRR